MKALVIGYGNPGRLDDGLGPALAEAVEKLDLPGLITLDKLADHFPAVAAKLEVISNIR